MKRLVEVRIYKLKPFGAQDFHEAMVRVGVPLMREQGSDVLAFGPALHEENGYFLLRAYEGMEDMRRRQLAFRGSDDWRLDSRAAFEALIETEQTTLMWLSPGSVEDMRHVQEASG